MKRHTVTGTITFEGGGGEQFGRIHLAGMHQANLHSMHCVNAYGV